MRRTRASQGAPPRRLFAPHADSKHTSCAAACGIVACGAAAACPTLTLAGGRRYVYHPFKMPSGPPPGRRLDEGPGGIFCNGYFGEPSGWQFQLDGEYSNCPADAEQFMPNYCYTGCEQNATASGARH